MRWVALVLLMLALLTVVAQARTTRAFLDRCATDESWCADQINAARRAMQQGVEARKRICLPQGLSDEGLVGEVTYWISEQVPSLDHKPDAESIAAALIALYGCDRAHGTEGL